MHNCEQEIIRGRKLTVLEAKLVEQKEEVRKLQAIFSESTFKITEHVSAQLKIINGTMKLEDIKTVVDPESERKVIQLEGSIKYIGEQLKT